MSNYNNSHGCPPPACQPVCGCPAGQAPDGPMGPIGATGPAGPGIISEYNPDDASSYKKGQLIVDNGNLYLVNKDDPQGVPGSSPDYTLLAPDVTIGPTGPEGPMGPPGIKIPTTFNPGDSSNYVEGQLIYDNGKIYIVNKDNPEGIPGQSPDYTELSPDAVPGPEGPTGPGGVDVPQDFNPDDAANYTVGNLIYYNGRLYVVCRNHPSGVPGSSPDYCPVNADVVPGPTGPGGPPGIALPVTWDAGDASSYAAGTIVYYNGNLYYVNKGNPSGTPGSSPDYDLIDPGPVPGPTGPTGIGAPAQWQPDDTVNLMQGQLVQYGDKLYVVNKDAPQGVPDSSPDYSEVQTKIESEGDTGPAGPTGPQGECGCDDQIIDNAVKVAALLACANDCISLTNQNDINIGHLYDMLGDLEGQINDNEDKLDEIEGANDPETQEQLDKYTTYCSGDPTHANASGGTSATTAIVSQGSPTDIGCFFGCTIYRQCYYGTVSSNFLQGTSTFQLPTQDGSGNSAAVTGIVKYGGSWTDPKGVVHQFSADDGSNSGSVSVDSNGNLFASVGGTFLSTMKNEPYYLWVDYLVCNDLPAPQPATDDDCNPLFGGGLTAFVFDPDTMDQLHVGDMVTHNGDVYQVMSTPAKDMNTARNFSAGDASSYQPGDLVTDPATGNIYVVNNASPGGTPTTAADGTSPNPDYTLMYQRVQ